MPRKDFITHDCYQKLLTFKEVIEVKDEERLATLEENERIMKEIADEQDAMEREKEHQEKELADLEAWILDMEQHSQKQEQIV